MWGLGVEAIKTTCVEIWAETPSAAVAVAGGSETSLTIKMATVGITAIYLGAY